MGIFDEASVALDSHTGLTNGGHFLHDRRTQICTLHLHHHLHLLLGTDLRSVQELWRQCNGENFVAIVPVYYFGAGGICLEHTIDRNGDWRNFDRSDSDRQYWLRGERGEICQDDLGKNLQQISSQIGRKN